MTRLPFVRAPFLLPALVSLLLLACAGHGSDDEPEAADVAPADDAAPLPDVAPGPTSRLVVIQTMGFSRELEKGVAPGFDVDGRISEEGDEESCGHGDFTSPDGTPGVDNQLALLVPLFAVAGIGAAESLLQSVIEEGGILLMLQVDGIDDPENDDDVTLTVRAGFGVPLLGTDGLLLSGQTFGLHEQSPETVTQAAIVNGVLTTEPFKARLPILVFGVEYELTFHSARIQARWTEDGGMVDGLLGGGSVIDELYTIGEKAAADDPSVLEALKLVLKGAGDLAKNADGECTQLSATLEFTAVSAFLFSDAESK